MHIDISPVRSLHIRTNESTASDGGVYVHGELALVDSVADKEYTSALGVAMRRDEMSATAKKQREELFQAARKGTIELDRVKLEQSIAKQAEAVTKIDETATV